MIQVLLHVVVAIIDVPPVVVHRPAVSSVEEIELVLQPVFVLKVYD
jgi:hypothetical protein